MQTQTIRIPINPSSLADYYKFLECKRLPRYEVQGHEIVTDADSYRIVFGGQEGQVLQSECPHQYDYQQWVCNQALQKKRYAANMDCGLGKTLVVLEWGRQVAANRGKVLLLCPLAVMQEFFNDQKKFSIDVPLTNLRTSGGTWSEGIGIMNYESLRDVDMRGVGGIAVDEASILKNGDGTTRNWLIGLSRGIEYRLLCSATPAPNEQAEYASQAVFLGMVSSSKEFYAKFFRKDGNDWILKNHARRPFYDFLKTYSCYIQNPLDLGFQQGGYLMDEPEYILLNCSDVGHFTSAKLFSDQTGLNDLRQIERYRWQKDTPRFEAVVEFATADRSIVWASRNEEEKAFHEAIPGSKVITGNTPIEQRVEYIDAFRDGQLDCLISKPKILGFGVNLQQANHHAYSGYDFSFEKVYQAIRRSHRNGRQGRLRVLFPAIPAELPVYDELSAKMKTFQTDVQELQRMFAVERSANYTYQLANDCEI
jgi:hypothetical protein